MIWLVSALIALTLALLVWLVAETLAGEAASGLHEDGLLKLDRSLASLFLFVDVRKLVWLNGLILVIAVSAAWGVSGSPALAMSMLVLWALAPRWIYRWMRQRRYQCFEAQLPDAIQSLAGALKAGAGLNTGFMQLAEEMAPPLSQELELLVREQRLGVPLDQALSNLAVRMPLPSVVLLVSTIRIAAETGGELAEALGRTAGTLRSIAQAEGKIVALTAQGKMQAWVVGLLPVCLMYVLSRMQPEEMTQLWTTPLGWGVLSVMAFLEGMGIWLIRRIVTIDV